jgi:uncharacterized protein YutE (UPF0331/DUF86 family)
VVKASQKVTNFENLVEFDIDASSILNVYEVLTAEDITGIQRLDETRNILFRAYEKSGRKKRLEWMYN